MDFIDVHYPHLLSLYHEIYVQHNQTYWDQLQQEIETYAQEQQVCATVFFGKESAFAPGEPEDSSAPNVPDPDPMQPSLF